MALAAVLHALALQTATAQLSYVNRSTGLQTPQMEGGATELEFGDVNGDGHVDIVSIGDHGSPYINTQEHGVMVWFGDGTGNWTVYQNGNFGYGGVALGDVNNDGLMDVGYGMHHDYSSSDFGDQILEVALGDGSGQNWTPWDDGLATNGETWGMFGTDFADVDHDGDLDIGSISFGCCAGVHVYLNNGDGTWTQSFGFIGGNAAMVFEFGDVNGDGAADIATAHGDGSLYLGDGHGGFTPADGNLPGGRTWRRGTSLGDATGDGIAEFAFATSAGGLNVWSWVSAGVWQDLSGTLPTAGGFSFTQIADMDLDGHGDLVAFSNDRIVVFGGDGSGNWQEIASVTLPGVCDDAAFRAGVDADHNGFPDMVHVAEENCQPWTGGTNRPRFLAEGSTPSMIWIHPSYPRGGETFVAGSVRFIDWHAAVPGAQVHLMTIEFSGAGPNGPWTTIADEVPNSGRFQWLVPATVRNSSNCHLRFTLGPAVAIAGPFRIVGGANFPLGDLNCDGALNGADIDPFFLALGDPAAYATQFPECDISNGDINQDGRVNGADIDPFFECLGAGVCP